jgi:uncharacterized protein (TIRG00374 family)
MFALWLLVPILLWWTLKDISLSSVWEVISGLDAFQILVLVILNALIFGLFTFRWWLLMTAMGHPITFLTLMRYRLAAFGVNYLTPGPQFGGEPLQVYLLKRDHQVPTHTAVTGVTLDKLLELVANFAFLVFGVFTVVNAGWLPNLSRIRIIPVVFFLGGIPIAYLLALWFGWTPLSALASWFHPLYSGSASLHRLRNSLLDVENGASTFCQQRPGALALGFGLSLLTWAFLIYEYHLALRFLGLALDFPQVIALLTTARLAFLTPMPGGLGALEAGLVVVMEMLGLDAAYGFSMSLVIRARDMFLAGLGLLLGTNDILKTAGRAEAAQVEIRVLRWWERQGTDQVNK